MPNDLFKHKKLNYFTFVSWFNKQMSRIGLPENDTLSMKERGSDRV